MLMDFENGHEKRFKSNETCFYFQAKLQEIHPACPQRMSILLNNLCLDLLESI